MVRGANKAGDFVRHLKVLFENAQTVICRRGLLAHTFTLVVLVHPDRINSIERAQDQALWYAISFYSLGCLKDTAAAFSAYSM